MRRGLPAALAALALAAAGCGSSGPAREGAGVGEVDVLYAGSLTNLMEHDLGPAFDRAAGAELEGYGAGSTALARQIADRVRRADVFVSASPAADRILHAGWYAAFARAPLVLGYDRRSPFAAALRHEPWTEAVTEHGIRVGRTDPRLDPKGALTARALRRAGLGKQLGRFPVYPEETLVGRLEAGQLDAAFLYANEAREQRLPAVALKGSSAHATYTVTIPRDAPHPAAARAFVRYLLGPRGGALLRRHGLTVERPRVTGRAPAGVVGR